MGESNTVSLAVAFGAGVLSFLSPCILPLIPAYISYITGISFDELRESHNKSVQRRTLVHSLFFVAGFTLVFVVLGASASYLGRLLASHRLLISRIGGAVVIIFGLYIMDVFKFSFFGKEKRLHVKGQRGSKLGAMLLGITFASAWTPCVGPILGSILLLAGTRESMLEGVGLLTVYSLGIAIPFIGASLLINSFLAYFTKIKRHLRVVRLICGLLLIFVGIMLIRGRFMF
ncbi:MAG: cytochrome c biogenesis protein CcdA [Candidatus Omnitrophica bacterium]|nr:cytochrome c biogenesis protein CcdA [Candidatus Omnitrophota bacterium]